MADARDKIAAEFELLDRTLAALGEAMSRPDKAMTEWMAIAGFVHNFYNGVENILKLALREVGRQTPSDSPTYHRDLIDLAKAAGVISGPLSEKLDEYRAFRHFFVHAYGIFLDPAQLEPLADGVRPVYLEFRREIEGSTHRR